MRARAAAPPAAASVCLYATPTVALGSVGVVVMVTPAPIVMTNGLLIVFAGVALSLNWIVSWDVPAAVGWPLITPFEAPSNKPPGKEPVVSDHLYGVTPPIPDPQTALLAKR